MPKRPTILVEETPVGEVTKAPEPIPVLVTLRYQIGLAPVPNHECAAIAWTATQVLVRWGDLPAEAWLPAADVRRA